MLFDPKNPLSEKELEELGKKDFDSFLKYLDSKSAYLKSVPLPGSKRDLGIVKMMSDRGYLANKNKK